MKELVIKKNTPRCAFKIGSGTCEKEATILINRIPYCEDHKKEIENIITQDCINLVFEEKGKE